MFGRALLLLCFVSLFGCAPLYPLPNDAVVRTHSLGMEIYDTSGETATEEEGSIRGKTIDRAWQTLDDCVGFEFKLAAWLMRRVPIVITPSKEIKQYGVTGDAGFLSMPVTFFGPGWGEVILVRTDRFNDDYIRHEWIHAYLYFAFGPEAVLNHEHEIFRSCEYIQRAIEISRQQCRVLFFNQD